LTPYTLPARTYAPSQFYQPGIADKRVKALITSHKEAWPELEGLHLLSEAGLYDLSGAGFFLIRQDMKKARKQRSHPLHDAASRLSSRRQDWTPIFLSMRDHYNSAASTYGMAKNVEDPDLRLSLERLAWPVAHQQQVWTYGRQYDVDPFLAMAIMRVESRYATNAVSRVGARGPMQIMPRTGRLIAAMRRDSHFSIEQLSEPQIAIDYGVGFYSLLMERFNGAYHLAAASYNAGPFAVSAWLQGTGEEMPIDEWVEHIPYHETRRYVKRTSRYYARYINLYTDASAKVVVKKGPFGDDASIVDF